MSNPNCLEDLSAYFDVEDIGEGEQMRPVEWLVEGLLHRVGTGLLAGHPQIGKTQLLALLAAKIVVGSHEFFGRRLVGSSGNGGAVLVVAAERPREMTPKIQAACQQLIGRPLPPSEITDCCKVVRRVPDLRDDREREKFIELGRSVSVYNIARGGNGLQLVLIDTVSKAFPVRNENDAGQVAQTIKAMEEISQKLGVFVLATHHLDATGTKPRGSGAYIGDADVTLLASRKGKRRELSVSKVQSGLNGSGNLALGQFTVERFGETDYAVARETSAEEQSGDEETTDQSDRSSRPKSRKSSKPAKPTATDLLLSIFHRQAKSSANGFRLEAHENLVRREFFAAWQGSQDAKRQRWSGAAKDLEARHGFLIDLGIISKLATQSDTSACDAAVA